MDDEVFETWCGRLKHLTVQQLKMIDEAISSVGEFGEVRLVVEKGCIRFVVRQTNHDAHTYQVGDFQKNI
jgi:hypothetical protein